MGRLWISDHESIQGHFALVHSVPMDSKDHFRMIRSQTLFGCINDIVMLVLVTVIVVYV